MLSVINSLTQKPYTPEMADMVCKYYNYIVKNKFNTSLEPMGGDRTLYHEPTMTHREASIRKACFSYDGLGFKQSFIDAFLKEFDNIVTLYENQPIYKVTIHYTTTLSDSTNHTWTETETVRTWGKYEQYKGTSRLKITKVDIEKIK